MKELVETCAVFFDAEVPGWYKKIKLNRLDFAMSSHCIGGQLFDGWANVPKDIVDRHGPALGGMLDQYECRAYTPDEQFLINAELVFHWTSEIVARRQLDRKAYEESWRGKVANGVKSLLGLAERAGEAGT